MAKATVARKSAASAAPVSNEAPTLLEREGLEEAEMYARNAKGLITDSFHYDGEEQTPFLLGAKALIDRSCAIMNREIEAHLRGMSPSFDSPLAQRLAALETRVKAMDQSLLVQGRSTMPTATSSAATRSSIAAARR